MEEIRQLIASYEQFLHGADKVLEMLERGELVGRTRSAAEEIAKVEKQMRDVEKILPTLRTFTAYGAPPDA